MCPDLAFIKPSFLVEDPAIGFGTGHMAAAPGVKFQAHQNCMIVVAHGLFLTLLKRRKAERS